MFQIKKFIQNFSFKRVNNNADYYIHIFGSSYFAVKNLKIDSIIETLKISVKLSTDCKGAFEYLWKIKPKNVNQNEIKIILSDFGNNWVFIYWNCGDYQKCLMLLEKLLINEKISANYYYADQYVDGLKWIISKKGKIIRQFKYQMDDIEVDLGKKITKLEKNFIEAIGTDNFVFGEDVFNSILLETCDVKNETYKKNIKFKTGTIEI